MPSGAVHPNSVFRIARNQEPGRSQERRAQFSGMAETIARLIKRDNRNEQGRKQGMALEFGASGRNTTLLAVTSPIAC